MAIVPQRRAKTSAEARLPSSVDESGSTAMGKWVRVTTATPARFAASKTTHRRATDSILPQFALMKALAGTQSKLHGDGDGIDSSGPFAKEVFLMTELVVAPTSDKRRALT